MAVTAAPALKAFAVWEVRGDFMNRKVFLADATTPAAL
jgi:hypothetical protein